MSYLQLKMYESHIIYFKRVLSFGCNNKSPFSGCTSSFIAFEVTAKDTIDRAFKYIPGQNNKNK